jgi:3-hydroxyisobutyrate dehydrogenase-like beta-hydroxyacid dehydrogenase
MRQTVGFIGLGAMGQAIVERLLAADYTVIGHNRTKSKAAALLDVGMHWADSPKVATEQSDVVFSMVANDTALEAITTGKDGILAGLKTGQVYADMSTVSPELVRKLAKCAKQRGGVMLDAPVSGSPVTVRAGKLAFMVAGDEASFEVIKPILLAIGVKVTYLGASGKAAIMKIALNLSIPVQLLALYEGLVLAEKAGINREVALEVMLSSAIASPALQYRAPFALGLPEEPLFNVTGQAKDLALVLELGRNLHVPLPTASATEPILNATKAAGLADEDVAAIFNVLANMAGLT